MDRRSFILSGVAAMVAPGTAISKGGLVGFDPASPEGDVTTLASSYCLEEGEVLVDIFCLPNPILDDIVWKPIIEGETPRVPEFSGLKARYEQL